MNRQANQSGRNSARRVRAAVLRIAGTTAAAGLLCAVMVRWSPGFGVDEQLLDPGMSRESKDALMRSYDQERNTPGFYAGWIRRTLTGDLGFSRALGRPVRSPLAERAPVTASLMLYGVAGAWLIAAVLAAPAIGFRLRALVSLGTTVSGLAACLPAAAIAIVLFQSGGSAGWMLALILFPRLYYYLRNLLQQGYAMPHVLLARAKGLGHWRILFAHVLLPARGQLTALAAVSINMAFGAAVAVEAICDLPG